MDEARVQAYVELIQKLLECPVGEEGAILNQHSDLVDEGFVQVALALAQQAAQEGENDVAQFLQQLVGQAAEALGFGGRVTGGQIHPSPDQLMAFWVDLLRAEMEGRDNGAAVHRVIQQNIGLLIPALEYTIVQWTEGVVAQNPEQAETIVGVVEDACISISEFPHGNYEAALSVALAGYDVVLALRVDNPTKRAQTLMNQANARLAQAELGIDSAANLERAIAAHEESAQIRRCLGLERDLSSSLMNQATARLTQARLGINAAVNLERAMVAYGESGQIMRRLGLEYDLSLNLMNQGNARLIQAQLGIDSVANVEQAIIAYGESGQIMRHLGLDPRNLSSTLMNQGNARLIQAELGIDPAANLERAIAAYDESNQISRRLGLGHDLSSILMNQGLAWRNQAQLGIDPAVNLERAISAYIESAQIMRYLGLERDLSYTLNNQGNARLIQAELGIDPAANLERAIAAYGESADIMRRLGLERDLSTTLMDRANAWRNQAQLGIDPAVNLERAISAYTESAAILRGLGLERDLSQTLMNQASARLAQSELGIDPALNLGRAIVAYEASATIRRRLGLERDLAATLYNMGNAYQIQTNQPGLDVAAHQQALKQAIQVYREALNYFDPVVLPVETLHSARALGNLHFSQGHWQQALAEGYQVAIAAVEQARTWATDDKHRQEVLENAIGVYANALQCYINLKQYEEAILLTERARSRHLVELMHSNDAYKSGDIPEEVQRYLDEEVQHYLDEYEILQHRIDQLQRRQENDGLAMTSSGLSNLSLRSSTLKEQEDHRRVEIQTLNAQKQEVWKKLRSLDRVLAEGLKVSSLSFEELSALIANQPTTALLSFYSTQEHTYILVLRHGETGIRCDLHTCTDQGIPFQNWILENWLTPYQQNFSTWIDAMPQRLADLSQRLQLDTLIQTHLQGIDELILIPHIALHLIPFAALPLAPDSPSGSPLPQGEGLGVRVLGDRFRIRVLPSAQILSYCHSRENGNPTAPLVLGPQFGSVEDATGDRPVVTAGFEAIAKRLNIPKEQRLRGKHQATKAKYRTLAKAATTQALHSIHHAASNLGNPLDSALQLADGDITLGHLLSPGWRMPHLVDVFLSCCETNLGTPTLTDDLLTLSTGFLCAGARSVVSTLWSVNALSTAIFCDLYYQFREQGSDRPTALQQAQQKMQHLSGKELKIHYQPLRDQLAAQWKQAEQNFQNYRSQLKALAESHPDYKQTKQRQNHWKRQKKAFAEDLYKFEQERPFASPYYWAGFVSQGLR